MQFDDETPNRNSDSQAGREIVPLRREVPVVERQRNALFAGVLGLAGVALGFGMGQFASVNSQPHTVIVHTSPQAAYSPASNCAPASDKVTWLGVVVESRPGSFGAEIASVFPGSPAAAAGLEAGQRIVSLGDSPVRGARELIHEVRSHRAGERLTIRVDAVGGQREARTVVLGQLSAAELQYMMPRRR
tara:strand:- start:56 stop:622 length:567 start_codon:yes stop_codon:yes gene_type:complete